MVLWAHLSLSSNQHLDRFSRLCRAHERDQKRNTENATPSVASSYCCDAEKKLKQKS